MNQQSLAAFISFPGKSHLHLESLLKCDYAIHIQIINVFPRANLRFMYLKTRFPVDEVDYYFVMQFLSKVIPSS